MDSMLITQAKQATDRQLFIAFELAQRHWRLAFSDGVGRPRLVTLEAGDRVAVRTAMAKARTHFGLDEATAVVSCYEAGRDGFWLHRWLLECGIENLVVDSGSIEVNRRQRRAKTDRLDALKLLWMLMRYVGGERRVWTCCTCRQWSKKMRGARIGSGSGSSESAWPTAIGSVVC